MNRERNKVGERVSQFNQEDELTVEALERDVIFVDVALE
jgi:hypothetical protein